MPCDLAITVLGINLEKTLIQKDIHTPMLIAALFTISKTWKQPKSLSTDEEIKKMCEIYISSVQLSCSVMSDSLPPQGLQQGRLPCSSQTPRAYSNSCPLSWWCHPTISSSVVPFSSWLQSFPASGSFPMSQFASGGQIWLPCGLRVKNPPAKQKTWVQSLGHKEPLEEGMAIHSSILA